MSEYRLEVRVRVRERERECVCPNNVMVVVDTVCPVFGSVSVSCLPSSNANDACRALLPLDTAVSHPSTFPLVVVVVVMSTTTREA